MVSPDGVVMVKNPSPSARSSLGDTDQFLRYAFAPAVMDGIGVCYHAVPDGFEFVLTYRESKCPHLEPFAAALPTGAVLLAAVVRKAAAG